METEIVASRSERSSSPLALVSLSLATLMSSLGISIANVALPTLAQSFDATFSQVQWVVLAYLLASTTVVVSVGRLGDLIGTRTLLLAGISIFTVASFACGLAPRLSWLIAARAMQGVGGAIMLTLAMAVATSAVATAHAGRAIGLLGAMAAIGTALGPTLGGLLIATLGWRALFLLNIPIGLLTLALTHQSLAIDRTQSSGKRHHFDLLGTTLLAFTLICYALAMTTGRDRFGSLNVALLILALVGALVLIRVELHVQEPLIRLAMFRDALVRRSLTMLVIVSTVMMATLVVGPFYLSRALNLDAAAVGFTMSVGPIIAAITSVAGGRITDRFGSARVTVTGLCGIFAGSAALSVVSVSNGIIGYLLPISLMTAGYAVFQTANNTALMMEAGQGERGVISGLLNLARNLGLISGASLMGAVFLHAGGSANIDVQDANAVATGTHATFAVAAVLTMFALVIASRRKPVSTG